MEKIKLGDLCTPSQGQLKEKPDTVIDYIDISSVDNETKKVTGYQTMTFSESPSRARKAVKRGSILVSTVRPNLNAVAILENDTPNLSVASTGFCILDCKEDTDERFVFNYCKSKVFIDDMVSQATGASYPAVSDKIVRSALIPAYSYEKQRHIGIILDKVSDVIEKRRAELQALDKLIKARFVELFGEYYMNHINEKQLDEICVFIDYRGKTPEKSESGIPLITAKNVKDNRFSIEPQEFIPEENYDDVMTRGIPRVNDVLFTTEAPLGNVCRIPDVYERFCVGQRLITMQPHTDVINSEYLEHALASAEFQEKMWQKSSGSTVKGIRSKLLVLLTIPVPPIELQNQFRDFVHQVDKSKVIVQKALDETQTLFDSLMQEYFG